MTSNGSLDGGLCSVGIANLANHDNIRVETKNAAETFGEGTTVVGVDRNLRNATNAVFNWIFKCDDFTLGGIQGV